MLVKLRDALVRWKFRFDWGMTFLVFLNFTLLVITASDKLRLVLNVDTGKMLVILIPASFVGTCLFGYVLDVWLKFPHNTAKEVESRSPTFKLMLEKLDRIEKKLEKNE